MATEDEATIHSELSPMRGHTDTEIIRAGINYGIRLEPINTNQEVNVDRTVVPSKNPSERGHIEMQVGQGKAGASPHTLQERRPRDNKETQRNSQTDEVQQIKQQQESLSGEEQEAGPEGATGLQEIPETTLPGTQNLSPGPFTFTYYGDEEFQRVMTSIIPREHQERTHLHGRDWCQDEHVNRSERLIQNKIENYTIKDAWINLIQAEDYLLRGITAFLPRI